MSTRRQGFTLIELMVVISIISLLSSIVLATIKTAQMKARNTRRQEDLRQILIALNLYYDDHGFLPIVNSNYPGGINGGGMDDSSASDDFLSFLEPKYISKVPRDPINNGNGLAYATGGSTGYAYAYYCYGPGHPTTPNTLLLKAKLEPSETQFKIADLSPGYVCKSL